MQASQITATLKARLPLIAGTTLAAAIVAGGLSMILPKTYVSTAAVVLDVRSPDPINGMVLQGMLTPGYMATQIDVIRSERNTRKVIEELKLDQVPLLREQWRQETGMAGNFESWLSEILQKSLQVMPARDSNVINISYRSSDPNFSAAIANAFVQSYQETTIELRAEPAKQYSKLFERQSESLKEKLRNDQERLSRFLQDNGMIAADERIDIETARLADLSNQLVMIQSMKAEARSRKDTASEANTEVLSSSLIASLKNEVIRQEAKLKEITDRLGNAHPQVTEMQRSIASLKEQITKEVKNVTSSLGSNSVAVEKREAAIAKALDEQRTKLLTLKEMRSKASLLTQEVDTAKRALETMQLRQMQTALESQANQTNISILKTAHPATEVASPKFALNVAIAAILGAIIGIAAAMLLEMRARVMRTDADITEGLGVPHLGSIGSRHMQSRFRMLSKAKNPSTEHQLLRLQND